MAAAPHLWPVPETFWQRAPVQALNPIPIYVGPMISRAAQAREITIGLDGVAFVYVVADYFDCLYVGKTIDLAARFHDHQYSKEWWPSNGRLVVLAVDGEDRRAAEASALLLEWLAIRDCRPLRNIVGVRG